MNNVQFMSWDCLVIRSSYNDNDRLALQLVDATDGSPVARATINLPHVHLNDDEVIIKDYSENSGMLRALVDGKIVSEPLRHVESGFITAPVCRVLI